ncbi:MAG: SGNH/GDSL hydrolase family protein [Acidimicrobiaceae bacterium]|jgi:lysophospholipase L1-like esterase|nr:SGNH/GDSL hydrolase family protein [Ilumatobacteraceae bacterium]
MFLSRVRTVVAVAGVAALLGACTGSGRSGLTELQYVGRIPGINSAGGSVVVDGVRANLSSLEGTSLGSVAAGNRLLVIGDSILAGTASRYGGALCSAVVPLGWRVAVEAEAGQLVGFGRTVLRDRIYEGWDAAVVFLGTNYGGSKENYERDLTRIVESLAPRPTLLLTATLFRDSMQQVNEVIRVVASRNTHVSVLDWGTASVQPGLLNKDRVHPTNAGRAVLVSSIAAALGTAPETPGACLPAKFTDDSLVEDNVMPATTLPGDTIPYGTTPPVATTLPVVASTTTTLVSATTTTVRQ